MKQIALFCLAVTFMLQSGLYAEYPVNAKKDFERKPEERRPGQMRPYGDKQKKMPPKPFLLAGDPRFEKMLKLALVDEDKLEAAIQEWPRLNEMSENEKRQFMRRVNGFRQKLRNDAEQEAEALALNIPEDKKLDYFRAYWNSRMEIEQEIRQQAEAQHESRMRELRMQLKQQWGGN